MTIQITKATVDTAAYDSGTEQRYDYSGRGMYGEECMAVVGSSDELVTFEENLAKAATVEQLGDTNDQDTEDVIDVFIGHLDDIRAKRREDSMGMSRVWYYPSIEVVD